MTADLGCYNIEDLRQRARRRLPKGVWEYLERGVEDETGMDRNRAAFDAITFVPRVGNKVEQIDTSHTILDAQSSVPFAIGPTGAAGMLWHNGDEHLALAAAQAGIPFTISGASTMDVEDIVAAGGRQWFQLYLWEDRELCHATMERVSAAGCDTLFLTLDLPVMPNREYLFRSGYGLPLTLNSRNALDLLTHPRWLAGVMGRYALGGSLPTQGNLPEHLKASMVKGAKPGTRFKHDNLDWDALKAFRDKWQGTFVLKGILHPDDAEQAVAIGADAIVVSNHGARSLDHSLASIHALPAIAERVGGKTTILFDSGVRRGSDVVKALALGADGVLVGRATLYGLAAGGEAGAVRAMALLQEEIRRVMGMLGVTHTDQITSDLLHQ